jgi:hypothetical protein
MTKEYNAKRFKSISILNRTIKGDCDGQNIKSKYLTSLIMQKITKQVIIKYPKKILREVYKNNCKNQSFLEKKH